MAAVAAKESFASLHDVQQRRNQGPMGQSTSCGRTNCSDQAITPLEGRNLCFDHFCSRSYELLQRIADAQPWDSVVMVIDAVAKLDECARRTLEISLSERELSNLDRAKLLDILLWSGDLTSALRRKRGALRQRLRKIQEASMEETVSGGSGSAH